MSQPLFVFTVDNATCRLTHDTSGWSITATPALHPTGRPGYRFDIPDDTNDGNGVQLDITAVNYVPLRQRGVLLLWPAPSLRMDDFPLSTALVKLPNLVLDGPVLKQGGQ